MSRRNVIQQTIDDFGRAAGFTKKAGAWYRRQPETIAVVELQKSQYSNQYYVNVALWLLPLGEIEFPKERTCHVRTRLSRLLPSKEEELEELLDLEAEVAEEVRRRDLTMLLESTLLPVFDACATLEGTRSPKGQKLIRASLVTGPAQSLLGS